MVKTRKKIDKLEVNLGRAIGRFFKFGEAPDGLQSELADAIEKRIWARCQNSFPDALKQARRFVSQVKRFGHNGALSRSAHRSLARTLHLKGDYQKAATAYFEARRLGKNNADYRARIDRALIDVFMYLGDLPAARRSAKNAIAAFEKLNSEVDVAMTQVNFANTLHRQDRHREAEKLYARAAEVFADTGHDLALARASYNRANTLLQLFEIDEARRLYQLACDIYETHDRPLDATDARYGLAWLNMLTGKFHIALIDLSACQRNYAAAGHKRGVPLCELDQAETLLHLNMFSDALVAARESEKEFKKQGLRYESSKSALFRAKAALALGKSSEARAALKRALSGFRAEKNRGFLAATHLISALLAKSDKDRSRELKKSRDLFQQAQLPLWETLCDLQLAVDPVTGTDALARLSESGAARSAPHLFAMWQTLLGDHEAARGRKQQAQRRWKNAAEKLDTLRAQLPPVELRTALGRQEISPHQRLIASELSSNPLQSALWSERYKTAGIWAPAPGALESDPARAEVSRSLAELAQTVAALSNSLGSQSGERGLVSAHDNGTFARGLKSVRNQMAALEKETAAVSSESASLHAKLEQDFERVSQLMPIVQFHFSENELIAFVHRQGKVDVVRYADGRNQLSVALRQWRFILESELLAPHLGNGWNLKAEESYFEELGQWLWKPLGIDRSHKKILIIPEGELANLPWEAIRVNGRALGDSHCFSQSPSMRHYARAQSIQVNSKKIEVFVGKSDDLPAVDLETDTLRAQGGDLATIHRSCRRSDWPQDGEYYIWHFSGHSQLRKDNPFYSFLALEDAPIFAADFRLRQARVELVTLAACRAAEQVALPGEESTGLVRSLLEMGARNVIGGRWPVSDDSTALWMNNFYASLFQGEEIPTAAQSANRAVRQRKPSAYHWAAFSVFGAGN